MLLSNTTLPGFYQMKVFDVLTSNDEKRIRLWVSQFKLAGPVVLILIMVVQMFLFVVPNVFIMIVAIVSYGPFWGAVISFLGSICVFIRRVHDRKASWAYNSQ